MTAIEKVGNVAIDYQAVLNTLKLNPKDPNVQALILVCQQYELDPVLKHMVLIQGAAYITHKGLWHMAHRSGLLDGEDIVSQGESDKEWFATVSIFRKDWNRPITMTGRYPKSATNKQYGPEMAVTRAECLVLRRMFDVAVLVQEEINWPTEARGVGDHNSQAGVNGAPPSPVVSRPALPPANVDPDTAEIIDAEVLEPAQVREPQNSSQTRRTFAAPGRSQSAENTDRIMAAFTEADETLANRPEIADLKKRIAALDGFAKDLLSDQWKAAGLPSVAAANAKLTKDQLVEATKLVDAAEQAVADEQVAAS